MVGPLHFRCQLSRAKAPFPGRNNRRDSVRALYRIALVDPVESSYRAVMRRFNLVDGDGTVRGEGVQWRDQFATYRIDHGEPRTTDTNRDVASDDYPTTLASLDVRWLDDVPVR
jgi:hypothetical protein